MEIQDQENEDKASMIAVGINSFNNYALHLDNEYIYIIGMEDVGSNRVMKTVSLPATCILWSEIYSLLIGQYSDVLEGEWYGQISIHDG